MQSVVSRMQVAECRVSSAEFRVQSLEVSSAECRVSMSPVQNAESPVQKLLKFHFSKVPLWFGAGNPDFLISGAKVFSPGS